MELLNMAPTSRPRSLQLSNRFSEDITSVALNSVSVSSGLLTQELWPRPLSFLPVHEFMPTLFLRSFSLPFLSLRAGAQDHSHIQDLCVPLRFPLFMYNGTYGYLFNVQTTVSQIWVSCRRLSNRSALKLSFSFGSQPKLAISLDFSIWKAKELSACISVISDISVHQGGETA